MPLHPDNHRTALYRLFATDGDLLYVGITNNPKVRWSQHAAFKSWWPNVVSKTVEWFDSREAAADAEVKAILSEGPAHNIRHARDASPVGPRGTSDTIASLLRRAILDGDYAPGEQLPTRAKLAAEHNVQVDTVTRALEALGRENLLRSVQRVGTFVLEQKASFTITEPGFYRNVVGYYYDQTTADWAPIDEPKQWLSDATAAAAEQLEIAPETPVLTRQYALGPAGSSDACQLVTHHVPLSVVAEIPAVSNASQLDRYYDILESVRQVPVELVEQFTARQATETEREVLELSRPGLVLVRTRRATQFWGGRQLPVEFVEISMPADRAGISYVIRRDASADRSIR
jgi:DNA-binding GntR family transcriptional regulator